MGGPHKTPRVGLQIPKPTYDRLSKLKTRIESKTGVKGMTNTQAMDWILTELEGDLQDD